MRFSVFSVFLLSLLCLSKQTQGNPDAVEDIIGSMKTSFVALSSKRDQWFSNYSQMKKLSDADKARLEELLLVSKLAIPMIWHLYSSEVALQKRELPKLVTDRVDRSLPYHKTFTPEHPFFHAEMVLRLQEESDFQIEILRDDSWTLFLLHVDYDDRRIAFSSQNDQDEIIEQLVVEGESFPAITPGGTFRVNIQVSDDCLFTSFWVGDLSMATPMPLPTKHHWCTRIYQQRTSSYSINVKDTPQAPTQEAQSSEESEEVEPVAVQMTTVVVYDGLLVQ